LNSSIVNIWFMWSSFVRSKINTFFYALLALNIFDAFMTKYWISNGLATETNILMKYFIDKDLYLFLFVKIFFVSLFLIILRKYSSDYWKARFGIMLCFIAYTLVSVQHVRGIFLLIG